MEKNDLWNEYKYRPRDTAFPGPALAPITYAIKPLNILPRMKIPLTLAVLLHALNGSACIIVHAFYNHCSGWDRIIEKEGNYVTAEMYDNGELVCSGGFDKRTMSGDWFPIHCNAGYSLEIGPRGEEVSLQM